MNTIRKEILNIWLNSDAIEEKDKQEIRQMMIQNPEQLEDAFYTDLEFGTGGLRGVMGIGTNRMNKYTVGMATQGLANYLMKQFPGQKISVVIARDSRNNSQFFCDVSAAVLSANGIQVYVFDDIRPTPELSFALRELGCNAGIMITASHNPKEYNGYKVYWNDGGQLVPPHDEGVIGEVKKISSPDEVHFSAISDLISVVGNEMDEKYFSKLKTVSMNPDLARRYSDMKIVYSPLHGTGYRILPEAMKRFGFINIIEVPPQNIPDGNFPTVVSPNPEEKAGLQMCIDKATETGAAIFMATDPDADRLGVGVRLKDGSYELLNGNQTAAVLTYYLLHSMKQQGLINEKKMIIKTIVTTDLLSGISRAYGVKCFEVLTGFKYIADLIRVYEGKYEYICGGEESYGFLAGDFIRDKDAVMTACLVAEAAAWAAAQDKNLSEILMDIAVQFGLYREGLVSLTRKGIAGMMEIGGMMENFRTNIPGSMAGRKIVKVLDYKQQKSTDMLTATHSVIDLPVSNVIQYILEDGSKITMRPSGTEPKIKFYFSVKGTLNNLNEYESMCSTLDQYIEQLKKELGV
jgi:phosphoglucomutase